MNIACMRCNSVIKSEECAKCILCNNSYHFECSISETSYNKINKNKKTWKCLICTGGVETRQRASSSTNATNNNITNNEIIDMKMMLHSINNKMTDLDSIKSNIEELIKNFSFLSEKYDVLLTKIDNNNEIIKDQCKTINEIKKSNIVKDQVIKNLSEKVDNLEQYTRNKNIEIVGLNEIPGENCKQLVVDIAKKLNLNINIDEVDVAHRVKSLKNNKSKNIIAQFKSRTIRDMLVQKRNLIITETNLNGTPIGTKLYINEHLTNFYKNLLRLAKLRQRETDFKFVWFKNSKIFARRTETSPIINIQSEEDVVKKMVSS